MAFDKSRFVTDAAEAHMGAPDRPLEALLDALGDNLAVLHAELAELKAACLGLKDRMGALEARTGKPEDAPEPARETGWAVCLLSPVDVTPTKFFTEDRGFCDKRTLGQTMPAIEVLWFDLEADADVLMNALGAGRSTLLYKDTLEEVE